MYLLLLLYRKSYDILFIVKATGLEPRHISN
nr:MAG TPA: hypothetical protein [Bacteriophage sp.]